MSAADNAISKSSPMARQTFYQQLDPQNGDGPQTYQDLMPKFIQELKGVDKREKMPELMVILEENFLKDDKGRWYIPDYTKSGDIAKMREKNLLMYYDISLSIAQAAPTQIGLNLG